MCDSTNPRNMLTRKAVTQDLQIKLRTALAELKSTKTQYEQLLQEQEESGEQFEHILTVNSSLKQQLVDLHQQYLEVVDERDKLKADTDSFKNCLSLYEDALSRIHNLECELNHANKMLKQLENDRECSQAAMNQSLYDELVGCGASHHSLNPQNAIIDLTEQSTQNCNIGYLSHNKIKKYIKLNKVITKIKVLQKKQKYFISNIQLRKERRELLSRLENYEIKLEDSIHIYKTDTQQLLCEIETLEKSLGITYNKYKSTRNDFEQLIDHCQTINMVDRDNSNLIHRDLNSKKLDSVTIPLGRQQNKLVTFSDNIGIGFGSLLRNKLGCPLVNYSMPGLDYKLLINKMLQHEQSKESIAMVLVGNCSNLSKRDITNSVASLIKSEYEKIMLCAFPYLDNVSPYVNNHIYKLNMHMQFLTSHYSDKFLFFDTNIFIGKCRVTKGTVYLPRKYLYLFTTIVASCFNSVINNMTTSNNTKVVSSIKMVDNNLNH